MLEEANTTETVARSESTPDLLKQALYAKALYSIEPRPGLFGVTDRFRRGDWLVEIFIIASIGLAGFLLISDGFFATTVKTVDAADVHPVNAAVETKEKETPDPQHGPRVVAMVSDGEKAIVSGLGDGTRYLEHILNGLKLASLQKSAAALGSIMPHNASFTRKNTNVERSSELTCAELNNFFQTGFVAAAKNTVLSHEPLGFISNPKMNGCAFVGETNQNKQVSVLGVSVEIETAPQLLIQGHKRSAVRYSLIMEIGPDGEIQSGRLRVEMPGIESPVDDGSRSAAYRLGDELAWVGDVTCASWLNGRSNRGSCIHVDGDQSDRGECAPPPRELLNQVADSVRAILSK